MALVAKKGTFSLLTSDSGSKSITGVGFEPQAIIFFAARTTTTGSYVVDGDVLVGAATGLNDQWCDAASMNHGGARSVAASLISHTDCLVGIANGVSATDFDYYLDTFDSDGFTLECVDAPSANLDVHYLAIGGLTAARAHYVTLSTGTAPYTIDETTPGFQPDAVLFVRGPGSTQADARFGMGVATSPTDVGAFTIGSQDDTAAVQSLVWNSDTEPVIGLLPSTASIDFSAELDSFLSTGFRLNVTDSPSAERYPHYLALQGGSWLAGIEDEGTASGAQDIATPGFDPVGVLLFGNQTTSILGSLSTSLDGVFVIGAGDGSSEGSVWIGEDDANASGVAKKRHDTGRAFWHANPATTTGGDPTTTNEADLTLGSEEFTLTWTQAGSSRKFAYLAFGDAAASTVDGAAIIASTSSVAVAAEVDRESAATIASSSTFTVAGTVDEGVTFVDGAAVIASASSVTVAAEVDVEAALAVSSSSSVAAAAEVDYEAALAISSSSSFTVAAEVDTDNLIQNWNFETDTSGWDGSTGNWDFNGGSTITRDNAHAHEGSWSGRLETPGDLQAEGVGYDLPALVEGETYRFSIWVYSTSGGEDIDVKLGERSAEDAFAQYTLSAGWNLCEVDWVATAGDAFVAVRTQFGAAQAITVWIDDARVGFPVELGAASISSSSAFTVAAEVDREGAATIASSSTVAVAAEVDYEAEAQVSSSSTVTATATPIRGGEVQIAASSTITVAAEGFVEGEAQVAASSTITATATPIRGGEAQVASSSTVAVAAEADYEAQASIAASSTITATAGVVRSTSAAISSSSQLQVAAEVDGGAQLQVAAASTITATATPIRGAAAQLDSASTITADAQADYEAEATIAASSTITVAGSVSGENFVDGAATISSSSSVSASAQLDYSAAAAVASSSTVAASAVLTVGGAAQVAAVSQLQVAAQAIYEAAAAVAGSSALAVEASPVRGAQLAVQAASTITATGGLDVEAAAAVASSSSVSAAAVVARGGAVEIQSTSTVAADGSVTLGAAVEVAGVSVFQAVAQLDAAGRLQVVSASGLAVEASPVRGGALTVAAVSFIAARAYGALQGLGCEVRVRTHASCSVAARARHAAALGAFPAFAVSLQPRPVTAGDVRVRPVVGADLTIGV